MSLSPPTSPPAVWTSPESPTSSITPCRTVPEDYVHRIGRTGRAEKEGDAFTILSADELPAAQAVERLIGQTVERRRLPDFEYQYTTMLDDSKGAQKALAENLGRGRLRVGKRRR